MTYQQLISKVSQPLAQLLDRLVREKRISQKLTIRVLHHSMDLPNIKGDYALQRAVEKLAVVLVLLEQLKIKEQDAEGYERAISRLVSPEGPRAVNEIFSHYALTQIFKSYKIRPLFGEGADGIIGEGTDNINVEIKSRFPQIYNVLSEFERDLRTTFPEHENLMMSYHLHLISAKGEIAAICKSEIKFIQAANDSMDFMNQPVYPFLFSMSRKIEGLEYALELTVDKQVAPVMGMHMSEEMTKSDDVLSYSHSGKFMGSGMVQLREVVFTLGPILRNELANIIISKCIHSSKNIPDEPRVIVIYTTHASHSNEFVQRVVNSYVEKHRSTMVLLCNMVFDNGGKFGIATPYIKVGSDIEETMKKYLNPAPTASA